MKVFILTEGGSVYGFGHITRCLSIYQAFLEKGITPQFIINGDEKVKGYFNNIKYDLFDWTQDEHRLLKQIESSDIVIIDTLLANLNLINKICEYITIPVFIDDFRKLNYRRGVVLDWTIYAEERYLISNTVKYLLGSKFVALRRAFWEVPMKIIKRDITEIVITMGGSDIRNLTPTILRNMNDIKANKFIIIGSDFVNFNEIESLVKEDKSTKLIFNPSDNEIVNIFSKADVAISASGQTLYELARIGTSTIAISIIDNQKYDVEGWLKAEFIEYAGSWDDNDLMVNMRQQYDNILFNFENRKRKALIAQSFVDGQGANRIVDALITMV